MLKIDVHTKDVELNPALQEYVNQKIGSLDKFSENKTPFDIMVELERTTHHHHKGYIFRAELQMQIPGKILRAEAVREDLRAAIDEAKDELEGELKKSKDKRKDLTKKNGRIVKALMALSPLARFRKKQ